jgi:hypothetical protein
MLARMFAPGAIHTRQDAYHRYFIDRDGDAFAEVLRYLRHPEMYVPPMLIPFAMLLVLGLDGWSRFGPRLARYVVTVACGLALLTSVVTIRHKIGGLVQVGDRAEVQFRAMLAHIPPGTKDKKILLLYYPTDMGPRATYSVFMCSDAILLGQPVTPEYYRPGDNLRLEAMVSADPDSYDTAGWDYVLIWDAKSATFRRSK